MKKFDLRFHSSIVAGIGILIPIVYFPLSLYIPLPDKTPLYGTVLFFFGIAGLSFAINHDPDAGEDGDSSGGKFTEKD